MTSRNQIGPRKNEVIKRHTFSFDKDESFVIQTEFITDGNPITETEGLITFHKIILNSNGNSADIMLKNIAITPDILRKLADELESDRQKVVNYLQ